MAAALRASKLVALDVEHLVFGDIDGATDSPVGDGMVVRVERSKTDQVGAGADVLVAFSTNASTCAVRKAFVHARSIGPGPLFRTKTGA